MSQRRPSTPGLILVTPAEVALDAFAPVLESVLKAAASNNAAGATSPGIVSVIIATGRQDNERADAAEALVPVIQGHDAAALVVNDTRLAGRSGADGIHSTTGISELRGLIERFRPDHIVGAGNLTSRHAIMEAAEAEPDYLYFGRLGTDTFPEPHKKARDLATWAAGMMTLPIVLQAGGDLDNLAAIAQTGVDHIALGRAIWDHPESPVAAIGLTLRQIEPGTANDNLNKHSDGNADLASAGGD